MKANARTTTRTTTATRRDVRSTARRARPRRELASRQHVPTMTPSAIGWRVEAWSYANARTRDVYVRVIRHGAGTTINFRVPR